MIPKWGKRLAFFAVFGFTGLFVLMLINWLRTSRGLDAIDWDKV